ncbi:MAG TPA: hypothetical protein VMU09_06730 [Acidimicrobiales bacterium]|nr:hypothetical protein [Acidimicrobiales bacterium]
MTVPEPSAHGWGWFAAWAIAGAGLCVGFLGALSIGIFVLPVAVVMLVVLLRCRPAANSKAGILSGLGLPLLVVAARSGGWTPWYPWAIAGVLLVAAGLWLQLRRHRSDVGSGAAAADASTSADRSGGRDVRP